MIAYMRETLVVKGRNDRGQRGHNCTGAESLWGTSKSSNNATSTFLNTVHLLPKNRRFEHGCAKLAPSNLVTPLLVALQVKILVVSGMCLSNLTLFF